MAFDSTPSQCTEEIDRERLADAIVRAVVGHSLGMRTCAEGVETVSSSP